MGIAALVVVLLVFTGVGPAWAACDGMPFPSTRATLDVGGLQRTFVVRGPSDYDGRTPAPLVFAFHPFGMNADYMASRAPIGRAWSSAIVLFPNGAPRPGVGGGFSWQGSAGEIGDRDLHFFDAMVAWVHARGCVDDRRVFVLGYSNGAQFSYLLGCERSEVVAGLAILSGQLGCQPRRPLPVIVDHGTRDGTIPFQQAIAAVSAWSRANRCGAPPVVDVGRCTTASACGSAPVRLCTHPGGHEYDTSFTAAAAAFFKSLSR
jgi:polyhydroxybutyrate depolymerase